MNGVRCRSCIWYQGDWCDKKHDDPDPDLERDCEHYRINTTAVTICNNCLRLKHGLCDGEKELTACPSYKRMTNADRIRVMTDEELTAFLHGVSRNCWDGTCLTDCPLHDACAYESHFMEEWLKQEVSDNG